MDQGFSTGAINKTVPGAARTEAKAARLGATGAEAKRTLSHEEKKAAALKNVSDQANKVWMADMFLGAPVALVGSGVAKAGMKRAGAAIKMIKSPLRALGRTNLSDMQNFRANTIESASRVSQITGGRATEWTEKLSGAAERAATDDAARFAKASNATKPFRTWIGDRLEKLSFLEKPMASLTAWREKVNVKKAAKASESALSTVAGIISGENIGKTGLMGRKFSPASQKLIESLKDAHASAAGKTGAEAAAHFKKMAADVVGLVKTHNLSGGEAKNLYALGTELTNAATAHAISASHAEAAGKGLRAMLKNLGHMGGRLSMLQGILAIGAAAAAGAAFATAKHESKTSQKALADMKEDLGANSAMVQKAEATHKSANGQRLAAAGVQSVVEAANVPFASLTNSSGMIQMLAIQGGLPKIGELIMPHEEILKSYQALQQDDNGELKLEPAARIDTVRKLVGAVPVVEKQGGYYNRLAQPVAAEIVNRKLDVHQTMKLLGDIEAFTALAQEVKAKLPPAPPAPVAHASAATKRPEHPQPASMISAAPAMQVSADRSLEGRVSAQAELAHA